MKKNRDTVGVEKNKKTSSNAELQADKAKNEQPKASQKSDESRRFTVSQRLIISVMVVVCVAALVYIGLEVVIRSVDARNEREFDRRVASCADYVVYAVNSYNADGDMREAVGDIKTMAYSLSGRILVIDPGYRVVVDSYDKETGKYMADPEVLQVMTGKTPEVSEQYDRVYRKIMPVVDSEGYTDAVIIFAVKIDELDNYSAGLRRNSMYLFALVVILGMVAAYFIAKLSVRDVNRTRGIIEGMKGGSLEQMDTSGMFGEMKALTKDINNIFNKAQLLEESRQEFVSNVSHELKTPITSMKVLSESLLTQSDVPAEMYREFMEDIVQEIDREAEIISDLLTLVKTDKGPDSLNKESVDMDEFMDLILKRLRPLADKRSIQLSYESFGEIHASIDKVKFTLAISNLIENGIKYNVDGGWIKVSLNSDHKNFYIKVADSGVGIPEDCINHIFERFYRVDKARSRDTGGTGLGLAITKSIIILHKGTINVYSEPGKGTTFTVRVPLGEQ